MGAVCFEEMDMKHYVSLIVSIDKYKEYKFGKKTSLEAGWWCS